MELSDAFRRIVGLRWRSIILIALLLAGIGAAFAAVKAPLYTSSARLVLATDDPKSAQEAASVGDMARAIATSLDNVSAALSKINVHRVATTVAREHVTVETVGSSGVLQLTVSDRDPAVASKLADELAQRLIATRVRVIGGGTQLLADANERLAEVDAKITAIDDQIGALGRPRAGSPQEAQRASLLVQRDALTRDRLAAIADRDRLLAAGVKAPEVIQVASQPLRDPSPLPLYGMLGALLGLLLAVGLSALIETLRPTVVGGTELAHAFDVPLLGEIRDGASLDAEITRVAGIIAISANACGRHEVDLMGVGRAADVAALADRLHLSLHKQMRVVPSHVPLPDTFGIHVTNDAAPRYASAHGENGIKIRWFDPVPLRRRDESGAIVLVTDVRATRDEVERARNLLQALARPVLGLITCPANAPRTIRLENGAEGEPSGSDTVTALVRGGNR